MKNHFDDFQAAKTEKNIYNHDYYNFNKIRFRVGIGQD